MAWGVISPLNASLSSCLYLSAQTAANSQVDPLMEQLNVLGRKAYLWQSLAALTVPLVPALGLELVTGTSVTEGPLAPFEGELLPWSLPRIVAGTQDGFGLAA